MENFQKIIELATAHEISTDMDLNVAAELLDSIDEKMKERVMTKKKQKNHIIYQSTFMVQPHLYLQWG